MEVLIKFSIEQFSVSKKRSSRLFECALVIGAFVQSRAIILEARWGQDWNREIQELSVALWGLSWELTLAFGVEILEVVVVVLQMVSAVQHRSDASIPFVCEMRRRKSIWADTRKPPAYGIGVPD